MLIFHGLILFGRIKDKEILRREMEGSDFHG